MANNRIQVKRTSTSGRTPNTTNVANLQYIAAGEFGLNMADQILYTSDGTNLITVGANQADQRITNTLTIDNNKPLRFKTVNTSSAAYFIQQNDDNFVFYTTDASYGARAVFSIYANSSTSDFQLGQAVSFNGANVRFASATKLYANGSPGAAGEVLTSNSTGVYWAAVSGSGAINVNATYVWSNLHTFQANVAVSGNNISLVSDTGSIIFAGTSDQNWKMGRNTGGTSKFYYTNNTIDIIAAGSNLEGFVIGQPTQNTYFETGYAGTFTRLPVYVGNTTQNVTVTNTTINIQANTTVNASITNSLVKVSNSTSTANLTAADLKIGTAVINSSAVFVSTANIASSILANSTGIYPTSNSVGSAFGNGTSRWNVIANDVTTGTLSVGARLYTTATSSNFEANSYTTGNILLGGVTQTGYILVGQSTNNQTVSIANGATISGNTKTVEIATNGAAGSQTNITIGTSLSNTLITVNANNTLYSGLINALSFTAGAGFGGASAGATVNSGTIGISSNTTVNSTHSSSLVQVSNSTSTANLTALDLKIGTTVVNSSVVNTASLYATTNVSSIGTAVYVISSGNVGIGTSAPSYTLQVNGSFAAITKSFVIDHPTKPGMKLRYGSLEGPENGIYVRGKLEESSTIELPDYWWNLIDPESITVNLTPYGSRQDLWVQSTSAYIINLNQPANCYFTVFAERKDVEKLVVEF